MPPPQATHARQAELAEVYLVPREVAVLLRRSLKATYRLMDDPTFPKVVLPGGGLLIPREALEKWLAARTEGNAQGMRHPLRLVGKSQTSAPDQRTAPSGALIGDGHP